MAIGIAMRPPSHLDLPSRDGPDGEVMVFVSDPTVRVELDVQIFDWSEWTRDDASPAPPSEGGHAFRMILWLRSERSHEIRWAVVLSGSARYRQPLPLDPFPDPYPDDPFSNSMREVGDVQIIDGTSLVGPKAETERGGDWDGEAVGPFVYRSGSWPDFGSEALIRLPEFWSGFEGEEADDWFGEHSDMRGPESFDPSVHFGSTSLPEFIRVDYANPPVDAGTLAWRGDELTYGATALVTDIQRAAHEAERLDQSLAVLGFAAGALLSALASWLALILRTKADA